MKRQATDCEMFVKLISDKGLAFVKFNKEIIEFKNRQKI